MNKPVVMMKWALFYFAFLIGCTSKTPEQKWAEYIGNPENKITQVIKIGETQATIKLLTNEHRGFRDSSNAMKADSSSGYYYFNMKFDKSAGEKPEKEKLLYLSFDMQQDFVMLVNQDSLPAAICQKIENGRGGSYEYLLAFEKRNDKQEEDFTVFYHDKIFGMGTVAFVYKQEDIKKIPALKTKTD